MAILLYQHPFSLDLEAKCSSQPHPQAFQKYQGSVLKTTRVVDPIYFSGGLGFFVLIFLLAILDTQLAKGLCAPGKSPFLQLWLGPCRTMQRCRATCWLWARDGCPRAAVEGCPRVSGCVCPLLGAQSSVLS